MRELVSRPGRRTAAVSQSPQQTLARWLRCEKDVLQVLELDLVCDLGKCGERLLDAQVVNRAGVDRQHRMRAKTVESESPPAARGDGLKLAANPVAPRVVHAKHRRLRRQGQTGSRPCLLD